MCFLIDAARQYIMVVTPWVNDRGGLFEGFKVNHYIVFLIQPGVDFTAFRSSARR